MVTYPLTAPERVPCGRHARNQRRLDAAPETS